MSLCVECLTREKPHWLKRYRLGWLALGLFGLVVFQLPQGLPAIALQALFFVILFPWTLWPLIAARRPVDPHQENSHG